MPGVDRACRNSPSQSRAVPHDSFLGAQGELPQIRVARRCRFHAPEKSRSRLLRGVTRGDDASGDERFEKQIEARLGKVGLAVAAAKASIRPETDDWRTPLP